MENIYDKPTVSITIFNENGLLEGHDTRWYYNRIIQFGYKFDEIMDFTSIKNTFCDFELYCKSLPLLWVKIYNGSCIVNCWGDTYDVLKTIVFFDSLIPSEVEIYFSTYDGLIQDEEFKYKRGQSILEFASVIDKEYEGTYKLVLEAELKKHE